MTWLLVFFIWIQKWVWWELLFELISSSNILVRIFGSSQPWFWGLKSTQLLEGLSTTAHMASSNASDELNNSCFGLWWSGHGFRTLHVNNMLKDLHTKKHRLGSTTPKLKKMLSYRVKIPQENLAWSLTISKQKKLLYLAFYSFKRISLGDLSQPESFYNVLLHQCCG